MVELRRSSRNRSSNGSKRAPEDETTQKEPEVKKPKTAKSSDSSRGELEVGDEVPDVVLKNQDEEEVSLKKVAQENKVVIIFSYPKASTPGCTTQACGFRDNYDDLKEVGAVFGLSADTPAAQRKFQDAHSLPFDLLSDPKRELIGLLGAKKSPTGTKRSHWVFANGKLINKRIAVSPEVSIRDAKTEAHEAAKGDDEDNEKKDVKEEKDEDNGEDQNVEGNGTEDAEVKDDEEEDGDFNENEAEDPELEEIGQEDDDEYNEGNLKKDEGNEADVDAGNGDADDYNDDDVEGEAEDLDEDDGEDET